MHSTRTQGLQRLATQFAALSKGKQSLLELIEDTELPESVYNSNAIENSTLTLDDTEKLLLHQLIPPHHSQHEIFEAINLAKVTQYLNQKILDETPLSKDLILLVHKTLLSHINDDFSGRFRREGEYVRVGTHIAPAPEQIVTMMTALFDAYESNKKTSIDRIIQFHLEFERIHPFCDGNGRVGRALINFQLKSNGYPPIIIRNKEKRRYYDALIAYDANRSTKKMEETIVILLKESFHKRMTYLRGDEIVTLSTAAKKQKRFSLQSVNNAAKKQSLPAFREKGRWKVGLHAFEAWLNTRASAK